MAEQTIRLLGRQRDEESLLDYNRVRCLDPAAGRFLGEVIRRSLDEDRPPFLAGDTNLSRFARRNRAADRA